MKINESKIRQEAKRLNMSMTQFAAHLGISRQLLNHYLKKGSTFSVVEKLSKALRVDPKDLITN